MPLLHEHATPGVRNLAVCFVAALWLVKIVFDPLHHLAHLPVELYEPVGPLRWLPESLNLLLISTAGLWSLRLLTTCALCASFFARTRGFALPAAAVLVIVYQAVVRGYGHVNHAELPAVLVLITFAFCELAERYSKNHDKTAVAAPLILSAGILCVTYSFTGLNRLVQGGLAIYTSQSLTSWCLEASHLARGFQFGFARVLLESDLLRWVIELGFPLVTLFEILAPLCLLSRRFRLLFLAVMIPFHAGVFLLMGILFWENLALYFFLIEAFFLEWAVFLNSP